MSRITTKILKMIIFLGIFAWYVYLSLIHI